MAYSVVLSAKNLARQAGANPNLVCQLLEGAEHGLHGSDGSVPAARCARQRCGPNLARLAPANAYWDKRGFLPGAQGGQHHEGFGQ